MPSQDRGSGGQRGTPIPAQLPRAPQGYIPSNQPIPNWRPFAYLINNSPYVIFFKPEDNMIIDGVQYENNRAYPLYPGESWYYPVDGVKTHVRPNELFKVPGKRSWGTFGQTEVSPDGSVDFDAYGVGDALTLPGIKWGWLFSPPDNDWRDLFHKTAYKP